MRTTFASKTFGIFNSSILVFSTDYTFRPSQCPFFCYSLQSSCTNGTRVTYVYQNVHVFDTCKTLVAKSHPVEKEKKAKSSEPAWPGGGEALGW